MSLLLLFGPRAPFVPPPPPPEPPLPLPSTTANPTAPLYQRPTDYPTGPRAPSSAVGGFVVGQSPVGEQVLFPASPGVQRTIRSYLYWEYSDDDAMQAFVEAQNRLAQGYLDWFNQVGSQLAVYTSPVITGLLLDWIAQGIYGLRRPVLASGKNRFRGTFGTFGFGDHLVFAGGERVGSVVYYSTSDDYFKRILTWHFYKGDGKYFDVRWLKRRVMRFLLGADGTAPNIDNTYPVSVSFGPSSDVSIRIGAGTRVLKSGPLFGAFGFGSRMAYGLPVTAFTPGQTLAAAPTFQAAMASGVLEFPFQYTVTVTIG